MSIHKKGCLIDNCYKDYCAKNYCTMHYQRFRKFGDPLKIILPHERTFTKPYHLNSGFKKGHIPWLKGTHIQTNTGKTHFKKGRISPNKTSIIINCDICRTKFRRKPSRIGKRNFCSNNCKKIWQKNYYNRPEMRQRFSEREKKRKRIFTLEYRQKMSIRFSGKNHPQWKGGITPINKRIKNSFLYKEWREKVFKRDDWTCQLCNKRSGKGELVFLHPHHIYSFAKYPQLRLKAWNGITLCKDCHLKLHKLLKTLSKILFDRKLTKEEKCVLGQKLIL